MAENDDPTSGAPGGVPAPAETTAVPASEPIDHPTAEHTVLTPAAAAAAPVEPRSRFTDRVWNFRAMVAVALAALLLGGGIGAAISAVSHDDGHDRPGFARFGGGPPGFPGGPGMGQQQRQQLRKDLKEFRQRMKQRLDKNAPTPTPAPATPSPTKSS